MTATYATLRVDRIGAVVFETDGVVADTAPVHAATWKHSLDAFLRRHCRERGIEAAPFDVQADYLRYLDGREVPDGVREFLASRGVDGEEPDLLDDLTGRQVELFLREIGRYGVAPFRSCVALVRELRDRHATTAAVSTTTLGTQVLTAAQVATLFDVRVDRAHLDSALSPDSLFSRDSPLDSTDSTASTTSKPPSKPARGPANKVARELASEPDGKPDSKVVSDLPNVEHQTMPGSRPELEEAVLRKVAQRIGVPPAHIAVVHRSPTGVAAARRMGFGLVVGLDRRLASPAQAPDDRHAALDLRRAGAHLIVQDLTQLDVAGRRREPVTRRR